jgi:sialate O-acetylesterase
VQASALYPWIRVLQVGTNYPGSSTPLPQLAGPPSIAWSVAAPSSVSHFSATCWFTGRDIADSLGPSVPLGLIESAWGGTSIQVWLSEEGSAVCGDYPSYPGGWPVNSTSLWNGMTLPFAGFHISAIVFYQGESNSLTSVAESTYYECALPILISSLRTIFQSPNAHAGIVQLAPWASSDASFNAEVASLREAQLVAGDALANISVITAVDGGDPFGPIGSIHPRAKQLVGKRLANAILTSVYGISLPFAGPRIISGVSSGTNSAILQFSKPLTIISPQPNGQYANSSVCPIGVPSSLCCAFQLQDGSGTWVNATATLSSDTSLLISPTSGTGTKVSAVSSGWCLWPITLVYSSDGLPMYPFNITLE